MSPNNTKARVQRNPYEQQEYQRKNPHLFTTMTQSVNPDGTITTYGASYT